MQREGEIQARLDEQQLQQIHDGESEDKDDSESNQCCDGKCGTCGSNHNSTQVYQCAKCHKHFGNLKAFQRHIQSHYARKTRRSVCHLCQSTFRTHRELATHMLNEHDVQLSDDNNLILKCCDCDETFDAHHKLHAHRMKHRHARADRLDDPSRKMPWEKDPDIDPPWIARDVHGNQTTDVEFRQIYSENRDTIRAPHDPGIVRGVYNFPIDDFNGETVIMRPHLEQILRHESHAFKINVAFGTILRNIETGEYRYYTAYYNNTLLDTPFRISRGSDINDLLRDLEEINSLDTIMNSRESTKWQKVYITNVTYFVYRMGFLIGVRRTRDFYKVPNYIKDSHAIVSLDTRPNDRSPYKDNLCAFRCLAWATEGRRNLEKRTKAYYNTWRRYQEGQGVSDLPINARRFKGIYFQDLPDFEKCFSVRTSVYTLHEDRTCSRVYQTMLTSDDQAETVMYLNLFEHHFSLITDFSKYAKKFACRFCRRAFDKSCNLNRHEKSCTIRVKYKFPGGIYTPTLSIFEELQQTLGVVVESDLQFYPWFAVYDFESVLKPTTLRNVEEEELEPTTNTQWTTAHIPVCVSIASNVEGFRDPRCIVDEDPDNLVKEMCEYLEQIQAVACALGQSHWSTFVRNYRL